MNANPAMNLLKTMMLASALATTSIASAAPPLASAEMRTALAKAQQGPDALRWYVQRTRAIYALDYNDVMTQYEAARMSAYEATAQVAQTRTR